MSDQLAFDGVAAKAAGQAGMGLAYDADRVEQWKSTADVWFLTRPRGARFTADDLVRACGLPDEGINRNNVVGAWFNSKSRRKLIQMVATRKSQRVIGHSRRIAVWEKL